MPNDEFGDFQTPIKLARMCVESVVDRGPWKRVLEPTCGTGSFLEVAHELLSDAEAIGVELQEEHAREAGRKATVIHRDIFGIDLASELPWAEDGPLLVVGNPPWVTIANLAVLESANLPVKENLKRLVGLEALTGASNFDIAEYIWIKLLRELQSQEPTIALLCKTQVARNVLEFSSQTGLPLESATIRRIDAKKWFGAMVDACLFTVTLRVGAANYVCDVYDALDAQLPSSTFGVVGGKFVSDVEAYRRYGAVDGKSPLEWRQGIKHDATEVMELVDDSGPRQKSGQPVHIESDYLYPLLKCTDVFRDRLKPTKYMVVPMRSLAENTAELETKAPKLWAYLTRFGDKLDKRQSSIYRSRSRFCVFGIGPYSFSPFKVAVSGLHKQAEFRLVCPTADGRPVVFDDTCYFLSFDSAEEASLVASLLRSKPAQATIGALAFWDSKRPITKRLLQRLDLAAIADLAVDEAVLEDALRLAAAQGIKLDPEALSSAYADRRLAWANPVPASKARRGGSRPKPVDGMTAAEGELSHSAAQGGLF
ncbi:MAG TPA: hypothetical protein VGB75_19790 [Jatrophihabitans sp.]|uniref:SAM-dependent methyltransferase n=1 Tax=Jatrophihabitans sp. TaxID=1932789 RepID=UPI002F008F31